MAKDNILSAKNFHIVSVSESERFSDSWRIFGKDYDGSTEGLAEDILRQVRIPGQAQQIPVHIGSVGLIQIFQVVHRASPPSLS